MMQRWDDLTPEEQQRYTDNEQLRQQLAAATKRAEDAEARVKEMDGMLDMLPEYLEYWDACDGPSLSLSEWYVYKDDYQEQARA